MITDDRRVRIITGQFGSGKTEFAVNYVRKMAGLVKKAAIADLDIVNPYFRSREKADILQKEGIEVISSSITTDNSDMPALSQKITVPFIDKTYDYVVDLGGGEDGTNVLGRLLKYIDKEETDFLMVVNVFRPGTQTAEEILKEKELLERTSSLKVTGFVNNSNLIHETTFDHVLYGNEVIKKASGMCGVPIRYAACMCDELDEAEAKASLLEGEFFAMHYNMRRKWMQI